MALSHADVLVHPVRMRIIAAMGLQKMTASEIAGHLADIPQASLYRHLALLVKADVVQIVETRPVRGAVEKIYALDVNAATLSLEELEQADRAEHLRYFTTYTAMLAEYLRAYLEQDTLDYIRDGLTYRIAPLELSDEEYAEMTTKIREVVLPYVANQPAPNRRRRYLAVALIPEAVNTAVSSDTTEPAEGE